MNSDLLQAAKTVSAATYHSFSEATSRVLDLLENHLLSATIVVGQLDHRNDLYRVVEVRRGEQLGLRPNLTQPLADSFCASMAASQGPRLCNSVDSDDSYSHLRLPSGYRFGSYVAAPLQLSNGTRVASLAAFSQKENSFQHGDEELFELLAGVLATTLEREGAQRDMRRLGANVRDQAQRVAMVGTLANALAHDDDARPAICAVAREICQAPIAFLLEPSGKRLLSTASSGVQGRSLVFDSEAEQDFRHLVSSKAVFISDVGQQDVFTPLFENEASVGSVLLQPILRRHSLVGILLVAWSEPIDAITPQTNSLLDLIAAHSAAIITHFHLHRRVESAALTDTLTGAATKRAWDEEFFRELARSERSGKPLSIALIEIDDPNLFSSKATGNQPSRERLLKQIVALWSDKIRTVDFLARLDERKFGLILPNCPLTGSCDVLDRLRASTPERQTISAGIARWNEEESAELLTARCQEALEYAKSSGDGLTMIAD